MSKSLLQRSPQKVTEQPAGAEQSSGLTVRLFASFACLAFVLFTALDFSMRLMPNDPFAAPEKSAIYWAASAYKNHSVRPDICLLGSSLMIAAQNDTDATHFRKQFDALEHYRSDYLEQRLTDITGHKVISSSFAIGGQMASDALTIFRVFLAQKDCQQIIVWGIAPRDFIDATFGNVGDTETVRFLSQFPTKKKVVSPFPERHRSFWLSINDALSKLCATYGQRLHIRAIYQSWLERMLIPFVPDLHILHCPDWLLREAAISMPEDNRPGQWIVRPMEAKGNEQKDNSREYEKRYRPFNEKRLAEQLSCYRSLLHEAQTENLRVLVVNMPLRKDNLALLPSGVYEKYRTAVSSISTEEHQTFLDLNDDRFMNNDFWDPVHLNGYGGVKFMDYVVDTIRQKQWLQMDRSTDTELVGHQPKISR